DGGRFARDGVCVSLIILLRVRGNEQTIRVELYCRRARPFYSPTRLYLLRWGEPEQLRAALAAGKPTPLPADLSELTHMDASRRRGGDMDIAARQSDEYPLCTC